MQIATSQWALTFLCLAHPAAARLCAAMLWFWLQPFFRCALPDSHLLPTDALNSRDAELARLMQAVRTGCAASFEAFYNQTVASIAPAVRRLVGSNYDEDVLADTYFQAWREAARFDPARGNAIAWLAAIARSRALDKLRAESVRHGGLNGAPEADADAMPDLQTPGPSQVLEQTQISTLLHAAMADLSGNERWVLGLAYFRELSQSEITRVTGLPLGTVKSLVTRSQQKLRRVMAADPQPNPVLNAAPKGTYV